MSFPLLEPPAAWELAKGLEHLCVVGVLCGALISPQKIFGSGMRGNYQIYAMHELEKKNKTHHPHPPIRILRWIKRLPEEFTIEMEAEILGIQGTAQGWRGDGGSEQPNLTWGSLKEQGKSMGVRAEERAARQEGGGVKVWWVSVQRIDEKEGLELCWA